MSEMTKKGRWKLYPYAATIEIRGIKPTRERTVLVPAVNEEDAKRVILRLQYIIAWEITITKGPYPLTKGLYEGSYICNHEIDYDLWGPLHYDNLAWISEADTPSRLPSATADGRGPHCIIV